MIRWNVLWAFVTGRHPSQNVPKIKKAIGEWQKPFSPIAMLDNAQWLEMPGYCGESEDDANWRPTFEERDL